MGLLKLQRMPRQGSQMRETKDAAQLAVDTLNVQSKPLLARGTRPKSYAAVQLPKKACANCGLSFRARRTSSGLRAFGQEGGALISRPLLRAQVAQVAVAEHARRRGNQHSDNRTLDCASGVSPGGSCCIIHSQTRNGKSWRLPAVKHQAANQSFAGTSSRKVSISEIRLSRTRTTSTPLIGS